MDNKYLTVTALNRYLAYKFENDSALKNILIKGEIFNFRVSGGHLYFSLKDETSEIRAVMFSSAARRLNFMPADGITVIIKAHVAIYQKGGTYNLNVLEMDEAGLGDIYLNFLRLRDKLSKEGLFDEEKKLNIPDIIRNIAVITSASADAFQDIVSTINKRFPLVKVYLYPALVQGVDAPRSIMASLQRANNDGIADVIIIARGGGSFEDLSCFNNEALAREIFNSKIPTVTGIGHETDFTIADYVSSRRAPTPTGAAVLVTKDRTLIAKDLLEKINLLKYYYKRILEKKYYDYQNIINRHHFKNFIEQIENKEKELERLSYNLKVHSPLVLVNKGLENVDDFKNRLLAYNIMGKITERFEYIDGQEKRLFTRIGQIISNKEQTFQNYYDKINILNPLHLMEKGYTLTYQNGKVVTRLSTLNKKDDFIIRFYDGSLQAKPLKTMKEE